jgi:hypothetical protein
MNYWTKIALCCALFAVFLAFELDFIHPYGITRLIFAFFQIVGPFAALYLVLLLLKGEKSKN